MARDAASQPASPTAQVIAIASQKGGVGKTTCALNLGAALVERGRRVLLIDLDPQANLTLGLGVDPGDLPLSVAQSLTHESVPLVKVIRVVTGDGGRGTDRRQEQEPAAGRAPAIQNPKSKIQNEPSLSLAPASIDLAMAELELANALGRDQALAEALSEEIRTRYDYILIDTPPTLGLLTINALVAARWVLVPVQAHFYALKGMAHLLKLVRQVRGRLNKELDVLGILTTFYDGRTQLSRQVLETLQEEHPKLVFSTVIKTTVRLAEAPISGESVLSIASGSDAAQAYRALAQEVAERTAEAANA